MSFVSTQLVKNMEAWLVEFALLKDRRYMSSFDFLLIMCMNKDGNGFVKTHADVQTYFLSQM